MLTTEGVTFFETLLNAFWVERMSDGTSLTGASVSPPLRLDSRNSGTSFFLLHPARVMAQINKVGSKTVVYFDDFMIKMPFGNCYKSDLYQKNSSQIVLTCQG
jgi:hypothetical protein